MKYIMNVRIVDLRLAHLLSFDTTIKINSSVIIGNNDINKIIEYIFKLPTINMKWVVF